MRVPLVKERGHVAPLAAIRSGHRSAGHGHAGCAWACATNTYRKHIERKCSLFLPACLGEQLLEVCSILVLTAEVAQRYGKTKGFVTVFTVTFKWLLCFIKQF